MEKSQHGLVERAMLVIAAILCVTAIYVCREVLIPLALAVFSSFLLKPVVRRLEELRLPRAVSVFVVAILTLAAASGLGWMVVSRFTNLAREFPQHRHELLDKARDLRALIPPAITRISGSLQEFGRQVADEATSLPTTRPAGGAASRPSDDAKVSPEKRSSQDNKKGDKGAGAYEQEPRVSEKAVQVQLTQPPDPFETWGKWIAPIFSPLLTFGIAFVFLVFFLLHWEDLRDRILRACGIAHVHVTTSALSDAGRRLGRYFFAQTMLNVANGAAIGIGLYILSVPNALLWAFLAAVIRFVPLAGTWIAAMFPIALSIVVFDGWTVPLLVAGWILLVDQLSVNLLEPLLYGNRTGASATAVFFAFVFWTWLWGGIGLILATPITVCLVVLGKHVPAFEIFNVLMGDEPVFEPKTRFYQRLLAQDRAEALAIARRHAEENSLASTYDAVVIPALTQIAYDSHTGVVDAGRLAFAVETVDELLDEFENSSDGTPPTIEARRDDCPTPAVHLVPDIGTFDTVIARMTAQLLNHKGIGQTTLAASLLTSEIAERVTNEKPRVLVFLAAEPISAKRIVHICKRAEGLTDRLSLLAGIWTHPHRRDQPARKVEAAGVKTIGSMEQLVQSIEQALQSC